MTMPHLKMSHTKTCSQCKKQTITTTKVGQLVHSPKKWVSFLVERGSIETRNDEKHSFIFHTIDSESECFMAMSPEFCCAHKLHVSMMASYVEFMSIGITSSSIFYCKKSRRKSFMILIYHLDIIKSGVD